MNNKPWFQQGRLIFQDGYGAICQAPDGVHTKPGDGDWNEHAKLIKAAPQLLTECQKQVVWLRHIMTTTPMRDSVRMGFEQSIKYLNEAIKAATE